MGMDGGPMMMVRIFHEFLGFMQDYSKLTSDPSASGVFAVMQAKEILEKRGSDAVVNYFTKILPDVKNESVQRAIHLQLADVYKNAGQGDKALDELKAVMTAAPAGR